MYKRHQIGKIGEKIACEYLEKNMYKIMERNFKCKQGEIDIIAYDFIKNEMAFIEVKTRTNDKYGRPSEAVTPLKLRHIVRTIKYYICVNKMEKQYIRIDILEVYIQNKSYTINHLKQVT